MSSWTDDYTRSRTIGSIPYTINDIMGRKEKIDSVRTSSVTASGSVTLLPEVPLARRDYIKVTNEGAVDVAILSTISGTASDGILIAANGGSWDDSTNAPLYIVSTGANSEVRVYERASCPLK
jgi:hypothetical protein